MDVEVVVDRDLCIGAGECVRLAPRVFDQDERAISVVVNSRGEPEERVVRAVVACPVQAITLRVGRATVGPAQLRDWTHGAHGDDPLVAVLEQLCEDHHQLRGAVATMSSDRERDHGRALDELTTVHLDREQRAYADLTATVDVKLIDAFEDGHAAITRRLDELAALGDDSVSQREALDRLAAAIEAHIRIEETVLFPVVLATLHQRRQTEAATTSDAS